jgi:formate dehydrogenase iron-sulfur subunit
MTTRIFVPRDAAARAVGADRVAAAIAQEAKRLGIAIEVVRTGSRGLFWLEPMIEVETPGGRIGFGPVAVKDVASLFADGLPAASHPLPPRR